MVTALNNDMGGQGEFTLVDGMLKLKSDTLGDSQLNVDSVSITDGDGDGADSINFPGFQTSQEGDTGTQTMRTTVYDGLGNEHSLLVDFTQTGEGQWDYEAKFADGESITGGSATGTLNFDEAGQNNRSVMTRSRWPWPRSYRADAAGYSRGTRRIFSSPPLQRPRGFHPGIKIQQEPAAYVFGGCAKSFPQPVVFRGTRAGSFWQRILWQPGGGFWCGSSFVSVFAYDPKNPLSIQG